MLRFAVLQARDPRKAMLASLLDLGEVNRDAVVIDDDAAVAFCEKHIPSWQLPGPINPLEQPKEAKARLLTAQKIVEIVTDAVSHGVEEQWARLEAALGDLVSLRPQGVMRLRVSVVECVAYWSTLPLGPLAQCMQCGTWTDESRCQNGHEVAQSTRERESALGLMNELSNVSSAFYKLDLEVVERILTNRGSATLRAAKLSVSVRAFGDEGSHREVEKLFDHAWRKYGPERDPSRKKPSNRP